MCPELRDAPPVRDQLVSQAARGSDVHVGRTAGGGTETPGRPVSLGIGRPPGGGGGVTATLTSAEARQLAGALLRQAAAAEGGTADATTSQVEVSYLGGESYAVATCDHTLLTDQPATAGGADTAII